MDEVVCFLQSAYASIAIMMLYRFLKPLLFCLPPEGAHRLALSALRYADFFKLLPLLYPRVEAPKVVWGLHFPNPLGLAAGLDKNGDYIDALSHLGFGFIEVGTVTPLPQHGNPKPRLFRLPQYSALINRMGFNNQGIDYLIERVKQAKFKGVLGINIGKNATTPIESALDDYLVCLEKAYPYASYLVINLSSPNTSGLRALQHGEFLENLLCGLKARQLELALQYQKKVPLLVKVAPDLTEAEVITLCDAFLRLGVEGVIATNTTISRQKVNSAEAGGLSGKPLFDQSTAVLKMFYRELKGAIPIIASGGVMSADDALSKIEAGADLVQVYSGLIYQGPSLVRAIAKALSGL